MVNNKLIEAGLVGYGADKAEVNTPYFNLVRLVIVEIIQPGKMASLLMNNFEALGQSLTFWSH